MRGEAEPVGEVVSEFAAVSLSIDHEGNGPRLRVEDLRTGHVGFLDALELETLAWLPDGALHRFLDPSLHRWRDDGVLAREELDR
ncbi:hypothetical protein [Conexibacter sp. SYSU D00693]|uniref:hypothetical protein n=1 Tax=Conexibacter sp. SYSU D00693 TaxID=2812560 RepID=UPI00196A6340|nr:hypothetical protein [Conexibacter sp. SYSU D00693]